MSDHTPRPDVALLPTLAAIAGHHGKRYCYPSQATIRRLHAQHTGQTMSTATLNRKLRALERAGFIRRTCRHRSDPELGWTFRSTLYTFRQRATRWLHSLAVRFDAWTRDLRGAKPPPPSLNNEKQFVAPRQAQGPGGLKTDPPEPNRDVALRAVSKMREGLIKK